MNCRDSRLRSVCDVDCPNIFAKCWTNPAARNFRFYVPDGILADIFYLSDGMYFTHKQVYKNVNHITNVCESALCTDIETNPGPVFYVDSSETISAPYSQGNQYIFGETAGQQCLAMFSNVFMCSYIQQTTEHMLTTRWSVAMQITPGSAGSHCQQSNPLIFKFPTKIFKYGGKRCLFEAIKP